MLGLAEGVAGGDQHAGLGEAGGELAALDRGVGGPDEVGLAVGDIEAALAQPGGQARALGGDRADAPLDQLGAAVQRLQRAGLGDLGDAEVGLELGEQLTGAGGADRVADAQPGEAPGLGEAAEDEQARMALEQLQRGAGRLRVGEVDERLVEQHGDAVGKALEQPSQLARRRAARRWGRWGWRWRSRGRRGRAAAASSSSIAALDADGAAVRAAGHDRIQRVGGPACEQLLAGLDQRAGGGAEQLGGAVAEDQAVGLDAVELGERGGAGRSRSRCG